MQFFATSSEFSKKSKICNLIEVDHTQACINIMKKLQVLRERKTFASEYRAIAATRNIYDKLEALRVRKPPLLNTRPSLLPETYSLTSEEDISKGGTINCHNNYYALYRKIVNISGATLMTIAAAASTQVT